MRDIVVRLGSYLGRVIFDDAKGVLMIWGRMAAPGYGIQDT